MGELLSRKSWNFSGSRYGVSRFWKFTLKKFISRSHELSKRISGLLSAMLESFKILRFRIWFFTSIYIHFKVRNYSKLNKYTNIILKQQQYIYIYIYISQIISYSSTSVIEIGKFSLTTIIQNLFLRIFLSSMISLPKSS